MKSFSRFSAAALGLLMAGSVQASTPILFEISNNKLVPVTQVGDSVFAYQADELRCDPKADPEVPCLASVDHWEDVCYQGNIKAVCPAFKTVFSSSNKHLIKDGAEEAVELLNCHSTDGVATVSYNLLSNHGGPNVLIKNKSIPLCSLIIQ